MLNSLQRKNINQTKRTPSVNTYVNQPIKNNITGNKSTVDSPYTNMNRFEKGKDENGNTIYFSTKANIPGNTRQERIDNVNKYFPHLNESIVVPKNDINNLNNLKNKDILQSLVNDEKAVLKHSDYKTGIQKHMVGQDPSEQEDELKLQGENYYLEQEKAGHFLGGKRRRRKTNKRKTNKRN